MATETRQAEERSRIEESRKEGVEERIGKINPPTKEKPQPMELRRQRLDMEKVQQAGAPGNPKKPDSLHPVVAAVSQIEFQGNLIPHSWWHSEKLRFSNGQPNFTAILILADICYWYRPTEKRDTSGKVVELRQKFSADMLQKSYREWAEQFDLNKRQIQDAVTFLVERGLVKRELRSFESRGVMLYNVTFFEPNAVAIRDLASCNTLSRQDGIPITPERDTPPARTGHLSRQNVIPITSGRDTCTKITQKTSPKKSQRTPRNGETQGGEIR